MKHLPLFALSLLLTACGKDDRFVEFGVTCDACHIAYVTPENVYAYANPHPHYTYTMAFDTVFVAADTIVAGTDTTFIAADTVLTSVAVDSAFVGGPFSWSFVGTYKADVNPTLRVESGVQPHTTTAFRIIDGKREDKVSAAYRGLVLFQ